MKRCVIMLCLLVTTGCPGSGGYNDLAPKSIQYGVPTTMRIELYKWGHGSDRLDKRFTNLRLNYAMVGRPVAGGLPMRLVNSGGKYFAEAELPAFLPEQGSELEYTIDLDLDGVSNRSAPRRIPVR